MVYPPVNAFLTETDSPSPVIYQMTIAPWLEVGFHAYLPLLYWGWDVCLVPVQVSHMLSQWSSWRVQLPCLARKNFLDVAFHLWLLQSSYSLYDDPWALQGLEGWHGCLIWSWTLHWHLIYALWSDVCLCVNNHPLHKEISLRRAALIYRHGDRNLGDVLIYPFSKIIVAEPIFSELSAVAKGG